MKKLLLILVLFVSGVFLLPNNQAEAAKTVTLKAVINPGTLLTDIRDHLGRSIPRPALNLGKVVNSIDCRTEQQGLNGTLGSSMQRIYVDNPKAAFDGWTLTMAAENGVSANWTGTDQARFDYNDHGGQGCTDADNDGAAGLLKIDPSNARLRSDCLECTTDHVHIEKNGPQSFADSPSVTLLRANSDSDDIGSWYITDIEVNQTIPPAQDGDSYELDMILTATAT